MLGIYGSAARKRSRSWLDAYVLPANAAIVTLARNDAHPAAESIVQPDDGAAAAVSVGVDSDADVCDDHGGSRSSQAQRSAFRPALPVSSSAETSASSIPPPTVMQSRRLGSDARTSDSASNNRRGRAREGMRIGERIRRRKDDAVSAGGRDGGADEGEQEASSRPDARRAARAITSREPRSHPQESARPPRRRAGAGPIPGALRPGG